MAEQNCAKSFPNIQKFPILGVKTPWSPTTLSRVDIKTVDELSWVYVTPATATEGHKLLDSAYKHLKFLLHSGFQSN